MLTLRRIVRTVPLVWWLAAIALATLTAGVTTRSLRQADAVVAEWGQVSDVLVVVEEVRAGRVVPAAALARRPIPVALVPSGALSGGAAGRVALVDLVPGEVVLDRRLAGTARSGLAALLTDDEHAVTIPSVSGDHPPAEPTDRVVLVGVPADGSPAGVVARGRVLAVDTETGSVTVAVATDVVVDVATAIDRGRVVITLVP